MAINALLGLKYFWEDSRIIDLARLTSSQGGNALLLFEASKQHTWLVRFTTELSCVLDDIRQAVPKVSWRIPQAQLVKGEKLLLELKVRPHKPNTGLIDIGSHHNWLYSIGLFQDKKVEDAVRELIMSTQPLSKNGMPGGLQADMRNVQREGEPA